MHVLHTKVSLPLKFSEKSFLIFVIFKYSKKSPEQGCRDESNQKDKIQ